MALILVNCMVWEKISKSMVYKCSQAPTPILQQILFLFPEREASRSVMVLEFVQVYLPLVLTRFHLHCVHDVRYKGHNPHGTLHVLAFYMNLLMEMQSPALMMHNTKEPLDRQSLWLSSILASYILVVWLALVYIFSLAQAWNMSWACTVGRPEV